MIPIVQITDHSTAACAACRHPLLARAMHLNAEAIRNKLSLICRQLDAGNDCQPLYIAARHGLVAIRGPVRARGIYRVPPQGATS